MVHTHLSHQVHPGKVILTGAGPGDPELLTLKAVRHLNKAQIVLTDDLVNPAICRTYAPNAQVIPVGKRAGKKDSTPQRTINALLLHYAMQGLYVVRLKGGDSGIFSNIDDELTTLVNAGITVEVVPGITAAQGVAAQIGMPLTARGLSQGIRLLTSHNFSAYDATEWQHLATTSDTLVFYMSAKHTFEICDKLTAAGKDADTPILLAEKATTLQENYRVSTLGQCRHAWSAVPIATPALLIIGQVAANIHLQKPLLRKDMHIADPELWGSGAKKQRPSGIASILNSLF